MFIPTLLVLLLFCPRLSSAEPIELTDKTWKKMLSGHWMVEFYAPWCSACQKFQPVWNDFSTATSSQDLNVASVNIEQYSVLSSRFRIAQLPTVFYVRDGVFRKYEGERSLKSLKAYIDNEEWQKTEPIPSYLAPNGFWMSFAASSANVPELIKEFFTSLQDEYGLPTWVVYPVTCLAVVFVGAGLGTGIISFLNTLSQIVSKIFKKKSTSPNEKTTDTSLSEADHTDDIENTDQTIRQRRLET
ncbi:unnamed protein product [Adineta ricciae]|uniref:Thioredoxin domain-containing protein n=1 Tax=Adineta ricciae TaxID=249248 RepID=A0A815EFL6_ADIRI|nr:unnamed protein product [Adineta ricciae]CAF1310758.1 unnamed protein product [Adineta ricciae]